MFGYFGFSLVMWDKAERQNLLILVFLGEILTVVAVNVKVSLKDNSD